MTSENPVHTDFSAGEATFLLLILVTRTLAGWFLAIKLSCSPIFMLIALVLVVVCAGPSVCKLPIVDLRRFPRLLDFLVASARSFHSFYSASRFSCSPIFTLIALVLLRPLSCLLGPSSTVHGGRRWLRLSRFSRRRGPLLSFLLLSCKVFLSCQPRGRSACRRDSGVTAERHLDADRHAGLPALVCE